MNKSELREIQNLCVMHKLGGYEQNIAQALSGLIRAAMTKKSRAALLEYAPIFGIANHPAFII
jgi:hypothetical protein